MKSQRGRGRQAEPDHVCGGARRGGAGVGGGGGGLSGATGYAGRG